MAQKQKRPSPHDVPPSVSSDEEPIPSSQPLSDKLVEEEEDADDESSEEEDDDDDDDDEEEETTQPDSKNPKPAASSESAPDSDSGSGSGSESESRGASNYQIQPKPLASKPMDETPLKVNSISSKRLAESNGNGDASRAKKKKVTDAAAVVASSEDNDDDDDDDGEVEAAEVKKSSVSAASDAKNLPFQRLFSEEDEIAILKGMIDFKKDTGNDPFKFADVFHGFMKKWLHIDASSNQLKQKIQRLKRKFEANAKGKSFSKPHDKEAFELSKKIWGNAGANEVTEKAKSNAKAPKSAMKEGSRGNVAPSKLKSEPKQEVKSLTDLKDSKEEAVKIETDEKTDIPLTLAHSFGLYGLNENLMKRGLDLMGASDRAKLEKEWRELEAAAFEASVKRVELIAKHARWIREAYEASNH